MKSQKIDSTTEQAQTLNDAELEQAQGGRSVIIVNEAIREALSKPPPRVGILPRWYWDILA
jgi:hypothetical protein